MYSGNEKECKMLDELLLIVGLVSFLLFGMFILIVC